MKSVRDVYKNYITHEDLGERGKDGVEVTIQAAEFVEVPDPKEMRKPRPKGQDCPKKKRIAIHIKGKDRPLLLCAVNAWSITEITGTEVFQNWAGHKITLLTREDRLGKEWVPCIRVKLTFDQCENVKMKVGRSPWKGAPN
jgi:hypothetical protein